jgi:hypothetical protein
MGSDDDAPEYALGKIGQIVVRSDGSFFTYDWDDVQVRAYDARGRFVRAIGRKGQGPGEYLGAELMLVGDSLLLIGDFNNNRITTFGVDGRYRRQLLLPRRPFISVAPVFSVGEDGHIHMAASRGVAALEGFNVPVQWLRLRLDGTIVDSMAAPPRRLQGRPFVLITGEGMRYSFPDEWVSAPMPGGGVVAAHTTEPIVVVAPTGGPVRRVERTWAQLPLRGAEKREWDAFVDYFNKRPGPRQTAIPDVKPFVRGVQVDSERRLWVHLYAEATRRSIPPRPASNPAPLLTYREPNVYEVLTLDGRWLARVELPSDTRLMAVQGLRLWTVREPPGESQRIVVYDLQADVQSRDAAVRSFTPTP